MWLASCSPQATWAYYRRNKLGPVTLFQVKIHDSCCLPRLPAQARRQQCRRPRTAAHACLCRPPPQILRAVHANDEKYQEVVSHLINVGLLSGKYCRSLDSIVIEVLAPQCFAWLPGCLTWRLVDWLDVTCTGGAPDDALLPLPAAGAEVRRKGGFNGLWGATLKEVNDRMAQARELGGRWAGGLLGMRGRGWCRGR